MASPLIKLTKKTPIQGRKKGNIAMEARMVATMRLIGVIWKIYRSIRESTKCSTTMKNVAWIRLVMEEIN